MLSYSVSQLLLSAENGVLVLFLGSIFRTFGPQLELGVQGRRHLILDNRHVYFFSNFRGYIAGIPAPGFATPWCRYAYFS